MDIANLAYRVDSSQLKTAGAQVDQLGRKSAAAGKQASTAGAGFGAMAGRAGAMGAAMVGVAFSFQKVISTLAGFEQAMAGVKAVTGATAEEMEKMRDLAKKLGSTTEFSASQAGNALRFLGMAGFSASESMKALPAVLNLATAGQMDLATTADIASNILTGFGLTAERTGDVADVLAKAASSSNTSVAQLGQGMKFVAPIAAALGISVAEAAAAMGVMSDAGIQGTMAGTGLRRMISRLAAPTKKSAEAIRGLGLTLDDVNPATNSLVDITKKLAAAGLDAESAFKIFGAQGAPGILAMTSAVGNLEKQTKALNKELDGTGKASEKMAATMRDTLQGDINGLISAVEGLIIAMGDSGLTDTLRAVIQGITALVRIVTWLTETFGDVVPAITPIGIAVEIVTNQASKAFEAMGTSVGEVFAWISKTAKTVMNTVVGFFVGAVDAIVAAWNTLPASFGEIGKTAMNAMISVVEAGLNAIASSISSFTPLGILAKSGAALGVPGAESLAALMSIPTLTLPRVGSPDVGAGATSGAAAAAAGAKGSLGGAGDGGGVNGLMALKDAAYGTGEAFRIAADEAKKLTKAVDGDADTKDNTGGGSGKGSGGGLGGAARKAGGSVKKLGEEAKKAASEAAKTSPVWTSMKEKIREIGEEANQTASHVEFFEGQISNLGNSMLDAIASGQDLRTTLMKAFADIALAIAKAALQMALFNKGPFSSLGGGGGGLFKAIGGLFGFANGTPSSPGGVALVGERGPELVNLPRGSRVTPNPQTQTIMNQAPNINVAPAQLKNIVVLDPSLVGQFLNSPQGDQVFVTKLKEHEDAR